MTSSHTHTHARTHTHTHTHPLIGFQWVLKGFCGAGGTAAYRNVVLDGAFELDRFGGGDDPFELDPLLVNAVPRQAQVRALSVTHDRHD